MLTKHVTQPSEIRNNFVKCLRKLMFYCNLKLLQGFTNNVYNKNIL